MAEQSLRARVPEADAAIRTGIDDCGMAVPRESRAKSFEVRERRHNANSFVPRTSPSRPPAANLTLQSCALLQRVALVGPYSPLALARQHLLEFGEAVAPTHLGSPVGLLLIRPEARLLHAQGRAFARRRERPGDDTLKPMGPPAVGQRLVRLDLEDLAIDGAPVATKIELMIHDRLEVVPHQPLLDQMWLRQRAPDLFRRIGDLTFDDHGACFGSGLSHGSILHFFERAGRAAAGFEVFSAAAARMSAFSASPSIGSPS